MTAAAVAGPIKSESSRLSYVPALDGLRAVAILGVLVFHALPRKLTGGFTGVDVFFVLSGYLITTVILRDLRGGKFSMREFYLRRIQRLVPNAVLMVLGTLALYVFVLLPSQAVEVARHGVWTIFNLSNVYIYRKAGGYWGPLAAYFPLLHTWSLAVEEQFYLVFPAILLFFSRPGYLLKAVLALLAGSLALCVFGSYTHQGITFYMLPTRAWEPLVGAVFAIYLDRRRVVSSFLGWAGLAAIVVGFFLIDKNAAFPGVIALVPTGGALAVLMSVSEGSLSGPGWLLSRPILVMIGKLSYSIYLWHWPLIVIAREYADLVDQSRESWTLVGAAAGVVLSVIAYFAIEQPLRRHGLRILACGFLVCVVVCFVLASWHPVADPLRMFDRPTFLGEAYSVTPWHAIELSDWTKFSDVLLSAEPKIPPKLWTKGGVIHDWGGGKPRVVVMGSSHALMYSPLIDDICKRLGVSVAFFAASATPVFFPTPVGPKFRTVAEAQSFDAARRKWLREWRPDAVLLIDRWDRHFERPGQFESELRGMARELSLYTKHVIVFAQVPALRVGEQENLREYVTWYFRKNGVLPRITEDLGEGLRKSSIAAIDSVARDFPRVQVLRVDEPFYNPDGSVRYSAGRKFLYVDDDHLSDAGTELVREMCTRAITMGVPR